MNRIQVLWKSKHIRSAVLRGGSIVAISAVSAYYWPELRFTGDTILRASRTIWTAARISWDYHNNFGNDEEVIKKAVHERSAIRLLKLFELNGGIYIKVGQHLAALEYLIPEEYCHRLSALHNQAPQSSLAEVEEVIKGDLGPHAMDLFEYFDPRPIGCASLAQVHRAVLKGEGGKEVVAVKVQHLRLKSRVDSDLLVLGVAVWMVKKIFPTFNIDWLASEVRSNLPKELDFTLEGHNSERLAKNIQNYGSNTSSSIRIPKINWNLTSKRVLTMEYMPGIKVSDRNALLKEGIDPGRVAALVTKIFSEMIFLHGFVHCDPHPGNLLIQPVGVSGGKSNRPFQLVILDHGLYKELPDPFRMHYAAMWKAVIDGNELEMEREAAELVPTLTKWNNNISKSASPPATLHRLLSCILTQRSWNSIAQRSLTTPQSATESAEIMAKAPTYLPTVADLLASLPRPLLLVLKTNDLLRHLERQLLGGDSPSNIYMIMAHYCVETLYGVGRRPFSNDNYSRSLLSPVRLFFRRWWCHFKLYLFQLYLYLK